MTYDMNKNYTFRSDFSTPYPVTMAHLRKNTFVLSGAENSADIVKISQKEGIKEVQNINTEGQRVYSACLLNGG